MTKFMIAAEESRSFEVEVEAETLEEAKEKLMESPSVYITSHEGEYIDGSFQINNEFTEQFLNDVIQSKSEKGYWSNEDGWGSLMSATVFNFTDGITLPMSSGQDSEVVNYANAYHERIDLDEH